MSNQSTAHVPSRLQERHEWENAILERARAGENVRDEAVLSLMPLVGRMAYRLYSRLSPRSQTQAAERHDLEQAAYERMLALFPQALEQEKPFRWLTGTAYGAMRDQLNGPGDPIKRHPREKPIPILRLEQPLTHDGSTLADILPDTLHRSGHISEQKLVAIEQAIGALPEKQRIIVERYFGFTGTPVSLHQICRDLHPSRRGRPNSSYLYNRALATLRQALADIFPHHAQSTSQAEAAEARTLAGTPAAHAGDPFPRLRTHQKSDLRVPTVGPLLRQQGQPGGQQGGPYADQG